VLIPDAGVANNLVTNPCFAECGGNAGNNVQPASPFGNRIPAIDVPAGGLEKVGVGMKCEVDQAMSLFLRHGDEMREQREPVGETAGPEADDN
jgi:hypothetical protein